MASSSKVEYDPAFHEKPFSDFSVENAVNIVDLSINNIHEKFKKKLLSMIELFLSQYVRKAEKRINSNDQSIYSGNAGIAYLYLILCRKINKPELFDWAIQLLEKEPINLGKSSAQSFLTGEAGKLCLIAFLAASQQNNTAKNQAFRMLTEIWKNLSIQENDGLLFGNAGYLYALLWAKKYIPSSLINAEHIKRLIDQILLEKKIYSIPESDQLPLMYVWLDHEPLGGAHGLGGIIYMLLQARDFLSKHELDNYIEPSIRYLMSKRFSSGNFPVSLEDKRDTYVQWCHGAPAMTMLFVLAHQVFGKEEYLQVAKDCGEVVWKRGLLKNNCGLCHGVAGNAYTFLSLFNYTKDPKYLYRACKFAEWCFDYELHHVENPDLPDTLFSGLPGVMYFLADLLNPSSAKFPGYDL